MRRSESLKKFCEKHPITVKIANFKDFFIEYLTLTAKNKQFSR